LQLLQFSFIGFPPILFVPAPALAHLPTLGSGRGHWSPLAPSADSRGRCYI